MARRLALLGGSLPWLVLLAWLSSVAWFLCDDAFISFRYVRNLVEGHGLVFNPGERVEGYSNFLWVLELAGLWRVFGLRPENAAPWLSVACTVGTLAATVWWAMRLPGLRRRALATWMALGLVCSSATFAVTGGGALPVPLRLLRRVAAEHLLRQARLCGRHGESAETFGTPCRLCASARTWPTCSGSAATTSSTARSTTTGRCWRFPRLLVWFTRGPWLRPTAATAVDAAALRADKAGRMRRLPVRARPLLYELIARHAPVSRRRHRGRHGRVGRVGRLTDATVARNPVTWPNSERFMAHDRRPPPGYILEERGVNVMVLPSVTSGQEGLKRAAYALRVGPDLWMPFDAADHDWVLAHFDRGRLRMREDRESRWEVQVRAIRRYEAGGVEAQ